MVWVQSCGLAPYVPRSGNVSVDVRLAAGKRGNHNNRFVTMQLQWEVNSSKVSQEGK